MDQEKPDGLNEGRQEENTDNSNGMTLVERPEDGKEERRERRTDGESAEEEKEELLKRWQRRGESTFWGLLGCEWAGGDGKEARVALEIRPEHLNLIGILHGGVHASLLDSTMGLVVMLARPDEDVVTTNLNLHYVAPVRGGRLVATAELAHETRRSAHARASVRTEAGELLAFGTGTFRIIERKAPGTK